MPRFPAGANGPASSVATAIPLPHAVLDHPPSNPSCNCFITASRSSGERAFSPNSPKLGARRIFQHFAFDPQRVAVEDRLGKPHFVPTEIGDGCAQVVADGLSPPSDQA